jgi:hypothetical protein
MAKKSDSRRTGDAGLDDVVEKLRRDAAPALARALNLDSAEAIEAALNSGMELLLAARAVVRALPLPPEAREHLDRAESEALRAARMAARGVKMPGGKREGSAAKQVKVDFGAAGKGALRKAKR